MAEKMTTLGSYDGADYSAGDTALMLCLHCRNWR